MSKLVEIGLVALLGGGLVVGAYQAGKYQERSWWRQELASHNTEVAATMSKLGAEAEGLDAKLLEIIGGDRAKLEDAETKIAEINSKPPAAADADGMCRPVPAHCLQREASGGAHANNAPTSRPGIAR